MTYYSLNWYEPRSRIGLLVGIVVALQMIGVGIFAVGPFVGAYFALVGAGTPLMAITVGPFIVSGWVLGTLMILGPAVVAAKVTDRWVEWCTSLYRQG